MCFHPFHAMKECEQMWFMHLFHIILTIKLLDEIIHLNGSNHSQIPIGPFGGSIKFVHVPKQ